MKIFITGATGFIGVALTNLLVKSGYQVCVLLRNEKKRSLLPECVDVIAGDLSIFENKDLVLPPFDIVIHLAGAIFAPTNKGYLHYNYSATVHLINCIKRQKWTLSKFIFTSSLAASGPSVYGDTMTELYNANPIEPYGKSKRFVEEYLDTLNDFPCVSIRPAIVLGPGDYNTLKLFKMVNKGFGVLVNGKLQEISFIDIDDLLNAYICIIQKPMNGHKIYFVSHADKITNKDLFFTIASIMNKQIKLIHLPQFLLFGTMLTTTFFSKLFRFVNVLDFKQYKHMTSNFVCSSVQFETDFNWKAQNDLNSSIQKAYKGYLELGML
ncbi:MAG: NAD(P)-dependent oxidoreductase [Saprospiraceae bacterium]|nr:NAD(P)-dependent oxidoreductase [Saprospiraceae bacterium]